MEEKKDYRERFLLSDKNLKWVRMFLMITAIAASTISFFAGIFLWKNRLEVIGALLVFGLPLLNWIAYQFAKFSLWLAYDIKMIRNKLYGEEESETLAGAITGLVAANGQQENGVDGQQENGSSRPKGGWVCEKCSTWNPNFKTSCDFCGAARETE